MSYITLCFLPVLKGMGALARGCAQFKLRAAAPVFTLIGSFTPLIQAVRVLLGCRFCKRLD